MTIDERREQARERERQRQRAAQQRAAEEDEEFEPSDRHSGPGNWDEYEAERMYPPEDGPPSLEEIHEAVELYEAIEALELEREPGPKWSRRRKDRRRPRDEDDGGSPGPHIDITV
jgi:hypothetical protein